MLPAMEYAMGEIKAVGLEGAKPWFFPSDYTHTNDYGAYKMASYVGRSLCALLGGRVKSSIRLGTQGSIDSADAAGKL